MFYVRKTTPAGLVSLADAKAHLRVDFSDEDAQIEAFIAAAVAYLDGRTGLRPGVGFTDPAEGRSANIDQFLVVRRPGRDDARDLANRRVVDAGAGDLAAPKDAERILREAGFSKSDATAFVSRVMRMGEERREAAQSTAQAQKAADRLLSSLTTP